MILVIWEYSTDKLSLIFILIIVEEINFLHCLGSGCVACLLRYSFYIFLSLDTVFALGLEVYAMITFVSAIVARAYGALHCLDIYFIVVKKIPKKYFVLIACERCVAMRIDREDLPRSFNDKLESMILVIWEYSTDKLSLICNGCSAE
jgi:hypothetical protein